MSQQQEFVSAGDVVHRPAGLSDARWALMRELSYAIGDCLGDSKNVAKGDEWAELTIDQWIIALDSEIAELRREMRMSARMMSPERIHAEAVDVATTTGMLVRRLRAIRARGEH